jgi:hypothetical protein
MAKAFTPGLKVSARTLYRARRLLPITGDVTVRQGDRVGADAVVAQTFMEGDVFPMRMANMLSANPKELPGLMLKRVGDSVAEGEPIARSKGIFGMMRTEVKSSAAGTIESVSDSTGMVIVRGPKLPVSVRAYIAGDVVEVIPGEGVVVQNDVALIQGIFGVGGETHGTLRVVCGAPEETLDERHIAAGLRGAVVVGGGRMTAGAIRRAREVGAAAVVSGGIDDGDLRDFLGHDIGVAVTGSERLGITLIVTEGFGDISMARRTFDLLRSHEGRMASVNGATQIRAGVMRPEIVIPLEMGAGGGAAGAGGGAAAAGGAVAGVLEIGTPVRIIRDPYFGALGTVKALPEQPAVLGSGSKARVLDVALADGRTVTVPRANVELIEE